ncbi:MAG: adenylyltransferase/cytidyltransferase family protein [SAR86 cluster bacterium]|nr:adenylyltransferase/cytidyltransferase family protein [SAR86 cluster bacterium]
MNISVVSGGFDPIHSGHISYIKSAKKFGNYLIIALNSDAWLINKKGKAFMPFDERKIILENLSYVDEVIGFEDDDKGSAIKGLEAVKKKYPNVNITFCNGGDRGKDNIPEMCVEGISFEFGVGGDDKKNSSSWILKEWQYDSEERIWGKFYNLFTDNKVKLKELIITPGKGMSLQKHFHRDEIWFVSEGECIVNFSKNAPDDLKELHLKKHDIFSVKKNEWHQIINPYKNECKIIEVQYGEKTDEDDIERHSYYENNE